MDIQIFWEKTCEIMKTKLSLISFETFIAQGLRPIGFERQDLVLEAATDFYHSYALSHYKTMLDKVVSQVAGSVCEVRILKPEEAAAFQNRSASEQGVFLNANLNTRYTFHNFIVGNNNRFAHAAALAVAEEPGSAYNPLFIYGGVGLGKTHLMHAIGNYILQKDPGKKVCYVTSEVFMNEMIDSIQNRTTQEFKEKYRRFDVLLVDDIQFLAGKDATQEEFYYTFNALHSEGKQVVITSDRQPKEIPKLEERLISRFEWGLIADIAKPDEETRYRILQKKNEDEGFGIDDAILQVIASRVSSNIRELEGCLTKLLAYQKLTGRPIDMSLAEEALREVFAVHEPRHITCADIIRTVSEYYAVREEDVRSAKRSREFTIPRQIAMYLSREMVDISLDLIGREFDRDHTTVLHACQKVAAERKKSMPIQNVLEDIRKILEDR